jgi:hypothetical protein
VRNLSYGRVFLVIGYDELFGAEDLQDAIVFAFFQGEESAGKSISLGLGHILASHEHITNKGLGGVKNADLLAV